MKIFVILITCLFTQDIISSELFNIKLEKNQKIQGTFSAELSENTTLHFVFTKNSDTKKFEIISVFVDSNQLPRQLDMFETNEIPSILSYHKNGSTLTLSNFYEKKKELQRIDFDVKTGKHESTITKDFSKPKNIFRLSNQTIFVDFDKMKNTLTTSSFSDSKEIKKEIFEFYKEDYKNFKSQFSETPEEVNQNEFVKNGSIANRKSYFANKKLVFTYEQDKSNTQVLILELNGSKQYKFSNFNFNYDKEIKDQNTYVFENLLLSVATSKTDISVNSYDLNTTFPVKNLSLQNDLNQKIDFETRQKFIESSIKSSMKPTVTLNKTKDNKFLVRLDRVNKNTYNYNHNWWRYHWMIQQQMLMQQHMMMRQSMPGRFGPSPTFYNELAMQYLDKNELKPIEFVVDANLKIDEKGITETVYNAIEREDYLEKFKDDKSYKEFTAGFTATEFRYIYFDKKEEMVYLKLEKL